MRTVPQTVAGSANPNLPPCFRGFREGGGGWARTALARLSWTPATRPMSRPHPCIHTYLHAPRRRASEAITSVVSVRPGDVLRRLRPVFVTIVLRAVPLVLPHTPSVRDRLSAQRSATCAGLSSPAHVHHRLCVLAHELRGAARAAARVPQGRRRRQERLSAAVRVSPGRAVVDTCGGGPANLPTSSTADGRA